MSKAIPSPSLSSSESSWLQRSSSSIGSNTRSSPIAIVKQQQQESKQKDDNSDSSSSSSFDDDSEQTHLMMVGSMPARSPSTNPWTQRRRGGGAKDMAKSLPAAPLLKARGGVRMDELNIPAFTLTEAEDPQNYDEVGNNKTAYGSLRESHIQGRFLDGPSSYREKGTGQIRYYMRSRSKQVRFDDSSTSYQTKSPLFSSSVPHHHDTKALDSPSMGSWSRQTPGERMQQALEEKQNKQQGKEQETSNENSTAGLRSSLSSLMLSAEAGEMVDTSTTKSRDDSLLHCQPYHHPDDEEEMKLSASLTGFEVLKRTPTLQLSATVPVVQEEPLASRHGQSETVLSAGDATSDAQAVVEGDVGYSEGQDTGHSLSDTDEIFDLDM